MRDYGVISPQFWTGSTGKKLRGDPDAQRLAMYLMTGPHAVSTGVYQCPIVYMSHEVGLTLEGASKALQRLMDEGFCHFDEASDWVFIPMMALHQIGKSVKTADRRHKWLVGEVEKMPKPLKIKFIQLYGLAYSLCSDEEHGRVMQAPSKPHGSQDQDHGQDQDQDQGQDHGQSAPEVPRQTFDGWTFVDQRLRPAYPRGTYRANHWIIAARAVERLAAADVDLDAIVNNAAAYQRQQEAMGNEGTQYILAPSKWLENDTWRGPFDLPAAPAKRTASSADRVTWRPDA